MKFVKIMGRLAGAAFLAALSTGPAGAAAANCDPSLPGTCFIIDIGGDLPNPFAPSEPTVLIRGQEEAIAVELPANGTMNITGNLIIAGNVQATEDKNTLTLGEGSVSSVSGDVSGGAPGGFKLEMAEGSSLTVGGRIYNIGESMHSKPGIYYNYDFEHLTVNGIGESLFRFATVNFHKNAYFREDVDFDNGSKVNVFGNTLTIDGEVFFEKGTTYELTRSDAATGKISAGLALLEDGVDLVVNNLGSADLLNDLNSVILRSSAGII